VVLIWMGGWWRDVLGFWTIGTINSVRGFVCRFGMMAGWDSVRYRGVVVFCRSFEWALGVSVVKCGSRCLLGDSDFGVLVLRSGSCLVNWFVGIYVGGDWLVGGGCGLGIGVVACLLVDWEDCVFYWYLVHLLRMAFFFFDFFFFGILVVGVLWLFVRFLCFFLVCIFMF